MGQKRSRDASSAVTRKRAKKPKKKHSSVTPNAPNIYSTLEQDSKNADQDEIILVDSSEGDDSDGIVVITDSENSDDESNSESESQPASKRQKVEVTENEVTKNNDFIGLGISSSDDEDGAEGPDHDEHINMSDDGVISDDNSGFSHTSAESKTSYPWVRGQDHSKQKEIADWLTLEIKDFVNYISPSRDEIVVRNAVINNLKKNVSTFWPATQAHVFGSCATDLYLPGSDIDMVVISTTGDYEQRSRLYQLSSYLRTNKLAKNIEVIASAKVPIIKFVDPKYNMHVDISFERTNGIDAARRIRKWLDTTPGLRELVLIVKQFLRSRRLNNVHVGGLGGYATIIMVYHFLKLHPRVSTGNLSPMENLGTLLIEFFELYGRNFSYDNLIIAFEPSDGSPKYLRKNRYPTLTVGKGQFSIVVQDPSDPNNNITRSSYNLRDLKKAFGGAYQLLTSKCYELNGASYRNRVGMSILGDIIKYKGKDRDFNDDRDKVANSALINGSESESDGAHGNDKYYFSDMTAESDDDTYISPGSADTRSVSKNPTINPNTALASQPINSVMSAPSGKNAEDYMSVAPHSEEEEEVADTAGDSKLSNGSDEKSKAGLDKDIRREYWKSKGLEI